MIGLMGAGTLALVAPLLYLTTAKEEGEATVTTAASAGSAA